MILSDCHCCIDPLHVPTAVDETEKGGGQRVRCIVTQSFSVQGKDSAASQRGFFGSQFNVSLEWNGHFKKLIMKDFDIS